MNEFNPFVDKLNFNKMSNMINFGVYIWLKSMLSVTLGKKCCIIKSMSSINNTIPLFNSFKSNMVLNDAK